MKPRIGDMYWVHFGNDDSSNLIFGNRPAVVVRAMKGSSLVHLVPLTTSENRRINDYHIQVRGYGLKKTSIALIEQVRPMNQSELGDKIGSIAGTREFRQIQRHIMMYFSAGAA